METKELNIVMFEALQEFLELSEEKQMNCFYSLGLDDNKYDLEIKYKGIIFGFEVETMEEVVIDDQTINDQYNVRYEMIHHIKEEKVIQVLDVYASYDGLHEIMELTDDEMQNVNKSLTDIVVSRELL